MALEFLTALDYTLEFRKGGANGNADFVSRLRQPATEHTCSESIGSSSRRMMSYLWRVLPPLPRAQSFMQYQIVPMPECTGIP